MSQRPKVGDQLLSQSYHMVPSGALLRSVKTCSACSGHLSDAFSAYSSTRLGVVTWASETDDLGVLRWRCVSENQLYCELISLGG